MKKQLFLMMLVFTLGSMQPIYAQGWLKALGEIAKGVLESDDASDSTAKSTSNSSSSGDKALYKGGLGSSFTVDGINIKFTECEQYGNKIYAYFVLTNTRASENKFSGWSNYTFHEYNQALSPNGKNYDAHYILAGSSYNNEVELPSGVPVKGIYVVDDYDMSQSSIKSLKFAFHTKNTTGECEKYELRNIPISRPNNTNLSNITCTHPRLYVQYNNCTRVGTSVVINLVLKNQESQAMKCNFGYGYDAADVYDDNGNSYSSKVKLSSSSGILEPGIPVKETITLTNVPSNVTKLSFVRTMFSNQEGVKFCIDMKNISIK